MNKCHRCDFWVQINNLPAFIAVWPVDILNASSIELATAILAVFVKRIQYLLLSAVVESYLSRGVVSNKFLISRFTYRFGLYNRLETDYQSSNLVSSLAVNHMNISDLILKRLTPGQISALQLLGRTSESIGVRAFLVGGTVRDLILDRALTDLDVSVECHPQELTASGHINTDMVEKISPFGTAKVTLSDNLIDVAMARAESYPSPGALPEVTRARIEDDLARRDFTINALASSITPSTWGEILDLHGGLEDIDSSCLRVLHNESFSDDPTRIFRAARYLSRLEFDFDANTYDLIAEAHDGIVNLTGTRIANELEKIFLESNPLDVLQILETWDVLADIQSDLSVDNHLKELMLPGGYPSNDRKLMGFLLLALPLLGTRRRELCERLSLATAISSPIGDLDRIDGLSEGMKPSQIHARLTSCHDAVLEAACDYYGGWIRDQIVLYQTKLRKITLDISGADVLAMGLKEGPEIGRVIETIKSSLIDGEISSKEDQIKLAQSLLTPC